jgi:hypothetical protein
VDDERQRRRRLHHRRRVADESERSGAGNCWRKSGLLREPADQQSREVAAADEERIAATKHMRDMNNLTELLSKLRAREPHVDGSEPTTPVTAQELLACDADDGETGGTVETYADYRAVMDFRDDAEETMVDAEELEAEYDLPPPPVTLSQAKAAAEALHTWTRRSTSRQCTGSAAS